MRTSIEVLSLRVIAPWEEGSTTALDRCKRVEVGAQGVRAPCKEAGGVISLCSWQEVGRVGVTAPIDWVGAARRRGGCGVVVECPGVLAPKVENEARIIVAVGLGAIVLRSGVGAAGKHGRARAVIIRGNRRKALRLGVSAATNDAGGVIYNCHRMVVDRLRECATLR